jgi:Tfp pilus assembly protein PilN
MTALLDSPNPAPPSPEPGGQGGFHLQRISANLLPDEIIAARRLSRLKRKLALAVVVLVVLLVLGYGYSWWQTRQSNDALAAEQFTTTQLTAQVQKFAPLVQAQGETTTIKTKLAAAMTDDLPWSKLLATLQKSAGSAVAIDSLTATVSEEDVSTDVNPLNDTGLQIIGDIKLTGSGPDYRTIASFVDCLSTVKGLAVVDPAQVAVDGRQLTFNVTLSLTTDILGGRFSLPTPVAPPASTGTTTAPASQPTGGQ